MLLSVAKNKPHKVGDKYFLRDIITVYFDLRINWWQACVNGTVKAGKDVESFENFVESLKEEIKQRSRKDKQRKAIIFINDLDVVRFVLPDGQRTEATKEKAGIKYSLEYESEFFVFRNFNIIANSKAEKILKMFPGLTLCEAMTEFLKMFDLPIINIRYSLAYITKKIFYKDIKAELWADTAKNNRIPKTRQIYYDMLAGNQGGLLSSFENSGLLFQVLHNIGSFDKRSAYPSYFINDRFFPVGRVFEVKGGDCFRISAAKKAVKNGQWFKVVIDSPEEIPELKYFTSGQPNFYGVKYCYGVELFDYKILEKCGVDFWGILPGNKFRVYRTDKTGYLPQCFREKVMYLYNIKNAFPDKNSPKRFMIKTQLDMLYGKGLQKFEFYTDDQLFKKYCCRGENFLLPQMSMHVVAAMRHELLVIMSKFQHDCIAFDTDGTKLNLDAIGTQKAIEFFDAVNDYITQKNINAGFYSNIGTWDFEYIAKEFIQFAPKVYAYSDSSGLHCKFAGVPERCLKKYLANVPRETIFENWSENGLCIEIGGAWLFLPDQKYFVEQKTNYEIRKGKLNG